MIILIDQKEYAVGLNWFAISSMNELEQFEREMELHHGVLKLSKDDSEQSTVALCGPEYNGQVSLAGMLSFAYANLIYVMATEYKDDNGQPLFYLCAVKNHAVTVDGDIVGTRDEIVSMYNQNYTDIMADVDPNSVNCFGTGVEDSLFEGLNLVETHHVLDQALRYAAQATVKSLAKKELSKGSLVLVAGLVLVGGFLFYTFFLKAPPPPPPPPPQAAAAPPPPPPPDPHQVYMQGFLQTLSTEPKVGVLASVLKTVETVRLNYKGWEVKTMSFNGVSPSTLILSLERREYANVDDLKGLQTAGVFSSVTIDTSGKQATAVLTIRPESLSYIDPNLIQKLPNTGSPNYYHLLGNMQAHNVPVNGTELEKNNYFSQMKLEFSGMGIWSLVALYNMLLPYETLALNTLVITTENGKYTWKIEGVIYG